MSGARADHLPRKGLLKMMKPQSNRSQRAHLPLLPWALVVVVIGLALPRVARSQPASDPAPVATAGTDHDSVVGAWGIEARRLASLERTLGQEANCDPCLVDLNAISLRRWSRPGYAWTVGLALGLGGGSSRMDGTTKSWDTYMGLGPTVGANFLLANWKHLAVSLAPQLDLVFFLPSGKGSKSFIANLRGLVEGEVHLGMIGLPAASVSLSSGIELGVLFATKDNKPNPRPNATALKYSLGMTGPRSLWDLVTRFQLRYYF
jgi:hypothetical protein